MPLNILQPPNKIQSHLFNLFHFIQLLLFYEFIFLFKLFLQVLVLKDQMLIEFSQLFNFFVELLLFEGEVNHFGCGGKGSAGWDKLWAFVCAIGFGLEVVQVFRRLFESFELFAQCLFVWGEISSIVGWTFLLFFFHSQTDNIWVYFGWWTLVLPLNFFELWEISILLFFSDNAVIGSGFLQEGVS